MKALIAKGFLTATLWLIATSAHSQKPPSYEEVEKMLTYFDKTVAATSTWSKKPLRERLDAVEQANANIARAEKLFGTSLGSPGSSCRNAAIYFKFYVIGLNDLALILEGRHTVNDPSDLYAPVYQAVAYGQQRARCFDYGTSLDRRK